jgi:hypothetical protein
MAAGGPLVRRIPVSIDAIRELRYTATTAFRTSSSASIGVKT